MTENKKTPVFTYLIAWLNPIIPPTIIYLLGGCLVFRTDGNGTPTLTWLQMHFEAVTVGCFVCLAASLWYYISVRNGRFRPRWWSNMLLIVFAYAIIPLLSLILPEEITHNTKPVAAEFWLISPVAFLIVTFRTGKHSSKTLDMKQQKFKSPWWIPAFIPAYYILFIGTAILCSTMIRIGFYSLGWLSLKINTVLRAPCLTDLTIDFVKQYLPGPKAQLAVLLNALFWATATWATMAWFRKRRKTGNAATNATHEKNGQRPPPPRCGSSDDLGLNELYLRKPT